MEPKHDRHPAEWPGQAGGPRQRGDAAQVYPQRERRRQQAVREAVFDIADFEAIAVFAGLRPPPARAG